MVDWDGAGYEQISDLQRTMARRSLSRLVLRGDEECLTSVAATVTSPDWWPRS